MQLPLAEEVEELSAKPTRVGTLAKQSVTGLSPRTLTLSVTGVMRHSGYGPDFEIGWVRHGGKKWMVSRHVPRERWRSWGKGMELPFPTAGAIAANLFGNWGQGAVHDAVGRPAPDPVDEAWGDWGYVGGRKRWAAELDAALKRLEKRSIAFKSQEMIGKRREGWGWALSTHKPSGW